ncbi:hypothetical Protein psc1_03300 [Candidatus Phytoplasma solani]
MKPKLKLPKLLEQKFTKTFFEEVIIKNILLYQQERTKTF